MTFKQKVVKILKEESLLDCRKGETMKDIIKDVNENGAYGGNIFQLSWFKVTDNIFKQYHEEITEIVINSGISEPEYFGKDWDCTDRYARFSHNKHLLVCFAFNEICCGLEV